jgi:hypothetical protein
VEAIGPMFALLFGVAGLGFYTYVAICLWRIMKAAEQIASELQSRKLPGNEGNS